MASNSSSGDEVQVKVVLLCKGRGGDPDSFRPNRDETQWVGRRDALVRCVASFLFGPMAIETAISMGDDEREHSNKTREVIMLFDDDLAQLRMFLGSGGNSSGNSSRRYIPTSTTSTKEKRIRSNSRARTAIPVPTEQKILLLWKRAAQKPNEMIHLDGMSCCITLDPMRSVELRSDSNSNSIISSAKSSLSSSSSSSSSVPSSLPPGLDSKRQVLQYLQKHCSIDFLRSKGLNSSPDVILRKTNKKKLMEIWAAWSKSKGQGQGQSKGNTSSDEASTEEQRRKLVIESIYSEILNEDKNNAVTTKVGKTSDKNEDETNTHIVAGILHETCPEFPCFGLDLDSNSDSDKKHHGRCKIFLFLGAVRDMTSMENKTLARICEKSHIPMIGVRFGTVPEFTSKILSLLAFHHAHNVLGKAIRRLLLEKKKTEETNGKLESASSDGRGMLQSQSHPPSPFPHRTYLHVICTVPMPSTHLSTNLLNRDRIHWCLVRVIVCSLWRSRLASAASAYSSSSTASTFACHSNALSFIFSDRVVVHLGEEGFVQKMAERHQAAPSEYQVLNTLKEEMDARAEQGPKRSKKMAKFIMDAVEDKSPLPVEAMICLEKKGTGSSTSASSDRSSTLTKSFYSNKEQSQRNHDRGIITLLSIRSDVGESPNETNVENLMEEEKIVKALISASAKRNISVVRETMCMQDDVQDREAASIVGVQHFCHQNRLHYEETKRKSRGIKRKIDG